MKKSLLVLISIFITLMATNISAQENLDPELETDVYLQDGNIMIDTDSGTQRLDYTDSTQTYRPYSNLKKWQVSTKPDGVSEALNVFEKKGEAPYQERYWIINKNNNEQKIMVEYSSFDDQPTMIFSPDEDYVYYKTTSDLGGELIFGVDLATRQEFRVGSSDDFSVVDCPDSDAAYISLLDEQGGEKIYTIYNLDGTRSRVITQDVNFNDLNKYVCY